jgi:hypothetical protein
MYRVLCDINVYVRYVHIDISVSIHARVRSTARSLALTRARALERAQLALAVSACAFTPSLSLLSLHFLSGWRVLEDTLRSEDREAAAEPAESMGAVTGADEAANNGGEGDEGEGNDAGDDAESNVCWGQRGTAPMCHALGPWISGAHRVKNPSHVSVEVKKESVHEDSAVLLGSSLLPSSISATPSLPGDSSSQHREDRGRMEDVMDDETGGLDWFMRFEQVTQC